MEAEEKALDLNKNNVLSPSSDGESDIHGFTSADLGSDEDSETENKVEE